MKRPTNIKLSKEIKIQIQKKFELKVPDLQKGEIALSFFHYKNKHSNSKIEIVYKRPSDSEELIDEYTKKCFERRTKCKIESLFEIELIRRMGFEHKSKSYTLATKSEEKRDTKTGKYD